MPKTKNLEYVIKRILSKHPSLNSEEKQEILTSILNKKSEIAKTSDIKELAVSDFIEKVPEGVHQYVYNKNDGKLHFSGYNSNADKMLGMDHSVLLGKTIEEAFPGLIGTDTLAQYYAITKKGGIFHQDLVNYKDQIVEGAFEIQAFQHSPGTMTVFFTDITSRKKSEEALERSEKKYYEFISMLPQLAFKLDDKGNIIFANKAGLKKLGLANSNLENGLSIKDIIAKEDLDRAISNYVRAMNGENFKGIEYNIKNTKGKSIPFLIYTMPERDDSGKIVGLVGIGVDTTQLKKYESKLHKLITTKDEETKAKLKFVDDVSHNLKTPMHHALGFINYLLNYAHLGEVDKEIVSNANSELLRLNGMLVDFHDAMNISAGIVTSTYTNFNLTELLSNLTSNYSSVLAKKGSDVKLEIVSPSQLQVYTDKGKLTKSLSKLLDNSVRFTEKGTITLKVNQLDSDYIRIILKDTGSGIHDEIKDKVFSPFEYKAKTTTHLGWGLGAYIAKGMIRTIGGKIMVHSSQNGTTWTLDFPITSDKQGIPYSSKYKNEQDNFETIEKHQPKIGGEKNAT